MPYHDYPGPGDVPHDYPDKNNPLKTGGKASAATPAAVADGDRVNQFYDLNGRAVVNVGTRLDSTNDSISVHYYNGSAAEAIYDNTEIILLASAQRAATLQSSDQTNRNSRAFLLVVNVSENAAGGSITPSLQIKDNISGNYFTFWTASAAITTASTFAYYFADSASGGSWTEVLPFGLPSRTWRLNVTHNNANNITYSVSGVILL